MYGNLWNSTQNILPMHWKMQILFTGENLRALRFKSSYVVLKCPPDIFVLSHTLNICSHVSGPILGLRPANERRRYEVTASLIGWAQT